MALEKKTSETFVVKSVVGYALILQNCISVHG